MLVAVQSLGSIWTARGVTAGRQRAYYNTTGVAIGAKIRNRSCVYGYVRVDECSGFEPDSLPRLIHRVFESEGVTVWKGHNKLFLKRPMPAGTRPDAHLFAVTSAEIGEIDRNATWTCDPAKLISFSDGNRQQEVLLILPSFGWVRGRRGTFCVDPWPAQPWIAALSRAGN